MRNIKLTIAYDGTDLSGWQVQPEKRTVQGELEKAFFELTGKRLRVHGSGRTDSGVHARGQVAHVKVPGGIPARKLARVLNGYLPTDIAVQKAEEAVPKFHARFDAKSKTYRYRILLSEVPDPFEERYAWRISPDVRVGLMRAEIESILGEHDFGAFRASGSNVRSNVREVLSCRVTQKKELVVVDIEATGFLYNMMRNMVGTLVEISRGRFPKGSMGRILLSGDRKVAGPTAPARGLFLMNVKY